MLKTILLLMSITTPLLADNWNIPWEAAKGDMEASIEVKPKNISYFFTSLPSGHDEANHDIKEGVQPVESTVKSLGVFKGRRVFSVEQKTLKSYYDKYYLIIAEVEPNLYLPIYVCQYASGMKSHSEPTFKSDKNNFSITFTVTVLGSGPSDNHYKITSDLKTQPKVEPVKRNK